MALTRKMLKAMGIEDEKIDQIIDAHTEVTDALKHERDAYKENAEKLPDVQKELDSLKTGEDWKSKYEKEHSDFETYKQNVDAEKVTLQKKELYKQLLIDSKIDKKRIDSILKLTDVKDLKIKDGKLEDAENLKKSITTEWGDFVVKEKVEGAGVDNPPAGDKGKETQRTGRAAELAKKYHEARYGQTKETK